MHGFLLAIGGVIALAGLACPLFPVGGPLGLRTPWAYASRRAWVISQRAAAVVGPLLGGLIAVAGARDVAAGFVALFVGLPVCTAALCVVSWVAWKRDPERRPIG